MHFQVERRITDLDRVKPQRFSWTFHTKDRVVARSAREDFGSEAEARSDIAAFKKTAGSARMAKVLSPGD